VEIQPVRTSGGQALETDPLLSKDIRFFFEPNSHKLDMANQQNMTNLKDIQQMLQVSPGSKVLLRGHVDNAKIEEFRKQGGEALVRQAALEAMQLSKNRAAEVRTRLLEQHKVEEVRVDTIGRGWEEPSGKDSEKNRRVEVYWYTLE
jgi:NitT/TauT family transport system substrate-binding protein